ncbi:MULTISPECIES: anti-phage deoxyguanosine triphosphatase [Serratia]|uniref:anti-phage deoxyguanosine triphosphatase n=1 Tax=Serratia TaxID=613 RepID=UPI0005B489E3|nr:MULTISPECIES: anti-phage deoxyguanosine triphosphatase [Serratia]ASL92718.1 dGTPase [Serratia marcescens]UMK54920.1 dGTPase [Serratia ureilytica]CAI2529080.1 Deoxyguanosinetriphosphate triphosphohydrolase [Serratia marcescens]CAI2779342.1 Deoxyguanosinetriphosphate triphosphohydrolase [Serratia marcescens]BEM92118.1 deoxyguanosinetriphosphate triphosphohydrolase-like protein [Serratia marcescens]
MANKWLERKEPPSTQWNDYARDRARIIHSASFRRLQGKTQVLGVGESDFYRTRLTHSLEVAQIGSGITAHLSKKYKDDLPIRDYLPDANLIEALGLAHDIGHPPFGHKGEAALSEKMWDFGGFEGNGQTLRICTRLGESSEYNGLNLTRRTLLGLLKYPGVFNDLKALTGPTEKPPKCILDTERGELAWIIDILPNSDKDEFLRIDNINPSNENGRTIYKSFDCSIMELSDDIAYAVHDLEDAIALKIINAEDFRLWANENNIEGYMKYIDDLFGTNHPKRKKVISDMVHRFIDSVEVKKQGLFKEPLIDLKAFVKEDISKEISALKRLTYKKVVNKYEIKTIEFRGGRLISELFDILNQNTEKLLPERYINRIKENPQVPKERFVCDFIAGMTDNYASMLYDRIFTTNSGSIFSKL